MTRFLLTILFLGISTLALAQGGDQQKKLEQRKAEIQKEIRELNELIKDESSKEKSVLTKISEQNTKIKLSEKLISMTAKQTRLLTDDIYTNQIKSNKLNRELKVLKEDYANMLVSAYKSRSDQSRIMFLLSSEGFLQAYKRLQYMKQYASFRKIQGDEIRGKMAQLDTIQQKLVIQKKDKVRLLAESETEKKTLEQDRVEQEKLVKSIRQDKKRYAGDITKKKKEAKAIERKIDAIIRAAIAEANKKTAKKAVKKSAAKKPAAKKVAKKSAAKKPAAKKTAKKAVKKTAKKK